MNPVCPAQSLGTTTANSCVQSSNLTFTGPGTFYLFAAPDVFTGVPCGSKYQLLITAPGVPACGTTAVDETAGSGIRPRHAAVIVRPNPFNPAATFEYNLPHAGEARIEIYDTAGRLVRTVSDHVAGAGEGSVEWSGRSDAGETMPAGIYVYLLSLDREVLAAGKAVLLK